jgi:hypothetical protein
VAFVSGADDLVPDDGNGAADVFAASVPRRAELRLEAVPPGPAPTAVRLSGAGFSAYERLDVSFDGARLALRRATVSGAPAGRVTLPAGTAPGVHEVSVTGTVSSATASATLVVSAAPVASFARR